MDLRVSTALRSAVMRGRLESRWQARGGCGESAKLAFPVDKTVLIREWDSDRFHQRVLDLEADGYQARRDTYRIIAEMSPETGRITHLYTMEMVRENRESA